MTRFIIIILFLIGCNTTTMKNYSYADGSGNLYKISTEQVHYLPVKMEHSSSGIYSGGDEKKLAITQEEYSRIGELVEQALSNKDSHTTKRVMMSGVVTASADGKLERCILAPRSSEKQGLEDYLKELIAR